MNSKNMTSLNSRGIASIVIILVLWEILVRVGIFRELFFSMPSKIADALFQMVFSGMLWSHVAISMETLTIGFLLALFVGIPAGIILGYFPKAYDHFRPVLFALSSLPVITMIPLVILWFGVGVPAKVFIIFFMALVPILINSIDGVRNIDKDITIMAKSFRASNFFFIRKVAFFAALPHVFSGIRSAVGRSIVGLVIGEAFGYGKGVGYLIVSYGNNFQTARLMALLLLVFALSLTMTKIVGIFEKRLVIWQANN